MTGKKLTGGHGWSFEQDNIPHIPETVSLPPSDQRAKVILEKRPKGKEATVITGFVLSDADRKNLAATLKRLCGSGGTTSEDHIEIQGDHRPAVTKHLADLGWRIR